MKKSLFLIAIFCALTANAQNYLISFAGTGESNTVGTVKVENLTTGASLDLNGNDILRLTVTTGINVNEIRQSAELKIYPNPTSGVLNLEFKQSAEFRHIRVINEAGAQVYNEELENSPSGLKTFDFSNLSPGAYFMTLHTLNKDLTFMFIRSK